MILVCYMFSAFYNRDPQSYSKYQYNQYNKNIGLWLMG